MDYTYELHEGQRRINGQLCRVDWKLIRALQAIYETLAALRPPVRDEFLQAVKQAIDDADFTSSKVASIKPPGCEPEDRQNADPRYLQALNSAYEIDANGWPVGFFEHVAGSMPELERFSQGDFENRPGFE